jgi:hypothetical protein
VAGGDVTNLVTQDRRQLGLRVEVGENAAGDVDEASRQREGVHHGIVDHREGPRQVGSFRVRGQLPAHLLHVGLQLGVVVQADGLGHVLAGLPAHGDLLLLADQAQLALAGGGVDGAAARRHEGGEDDRECFTRALPRKLAHGAPPR